MGDITVATTVPTIKSETCIDLQCSFLDVNLFLLPTKEQNMMFFDEYPFNVYDMLYQSAQHIVPRYLEFFLSVVVISVVESSCFIIGYILYTAVQNANRKGLPRD